LYEVLPIFTSGNVACGLQKSARCAADAKSGERRKRLIFFEKHYGKAATQE
jgi:hypothetical protein